MRGQAGFFDVDERLREISAKLAVILHRMWVDGTDFRFAAAPVAPAAAA